MTTFVQLAEAPRLREDPKNYRAGFRSFADAVGDPKVDRVLLIEPSAIKVPALRELWATWAHVEIRQMAVRGDCTESGEATLFEVDGEDASEHICTPDRDLALTFHPNGKPRPRSLPCVSLEGLLRDLRTSGEVQLLSLDLRSTSAEVVRDADWKLFHGTAVSLSTVGVSAVDVREAARALRAAGFRSAGRAWGEAGTGRLFRRAASPGDRVQIATAQAKVSTGVALVHVRDAVPTVRRRLATLGRTHNDLDYSNGMGLIQPSPWEVYRLVQGVRQATLRPWDLEAIPKPGINAVAHECHERHGVWPISFSYPKPLREATLKPSQSISHIVPGFPYSFVDENEYLDTYSQAAIAVTHRKAGWDCFRHLEILAAGSVPLMIDVSDVPDYSMIHYPKEAIRRIRDAVLDEGRIPGLRTRQLLHDFSARHLSSAGMIEYVLDVIGRPDAEKVTFVDAAVPTAADYLSLMTLIGLKQTRGTDCRVTHPVDYIYEDFSERHRYLYGRGFGYSRSVPASARGASESRGTEPRAPESADARSTELVVIGSIMRNLDLARAWLRVVPPDRTIWIHGEDSPPSPAEVRFLRESGVHVFVRAIEPPGSRRIRK